MRSNNFIKTAAESNKCLKADAGIRTADPPSETGYALENAAAQADLNGAGIRFQPDDDPLAIMW